MSSSVTRVASQTCGSPDPSTSRITGSPTSEGSDIYAWRGRIGLINPTHRGKVFAFWYRNVPDGVEIVPTFLGFRKGEKRDFLDSFARAEQLASELKDVGCTILAVSGTPPFLLKGPEFEREWGARVSRATGLPIVTPVRPHVDALVAMGMRRVAVATYYGDELNDAIVHYLATFGIEAFVMGGYRATSDSEQLYTTPLAALDDVTAAQVYRYCRDGLDQVERAHGSVDGIYINGGGWDAFPVVDVLERDLGTKVVWALAAELWEVCVRSKVAIHIERGGVLLRENYQLPRA